MSDFFFNGKTLRLDFYSEWERHIFCKAGTVLEYYVYFKAIQKPEINECVMNCYLDWEGNGNPKYRDTEGDDVCNEIDVLYMRKNIPTFISCKNFHVSENKILYELETVANRFGGAHVQKILLARDGVSKSIKNRAKEMGIRVVKDI